MTRRSLFPSVAATSAERHESRVGDELITHADVVMDRAFTVNAPPEAVWPWIEQLGKWRGGWYLSRRLESMIPAQRRALRHIDQQFLGLTAGSVIPDYGGRNETFRVTTVERPRHLVYISQRGRTMVSWAIELRPQQRETATRLLFRLRLAPVKRVWLARSVGEFIDGLTIAGFAAGLAERVRPQNS